MPDKFSFINVHLNSYSKNEDKRNLYKVRKQTKTTDIIVVMFCFAHFKQLFLRKSSIEATYYNSLGGIFIQSY